MPNTSREFVVAAFIGMVACASSAPATEPTTPDTAPTETPPPAPAPRELDCRASTQDAYDVVNAHNECTADDECATAAAGCLSEFACGIAVSADDAAQVDAELSPIWKRYKAVCGDCVRERVRCMKPSAVCREGRCTTNPER